MLDLAIIVLVVFSVLRGYLHGALRDLLSLGALVVALIASAPFGEPVGRLLARHWSLTASDAYIAGRFVAGCVIFVSLMVCAHVLNRKFGQTPDGVTKGWNRRLGALCGLASGVLTALIVLFLADSVVKAAAPDAQGAVIEALRESRLRQQISAHNPADQFLVTDTLHLLRLARENPEVLGKLRGRPEVQALFQNPDVQEAMRDEELTAAAERHDLAAMLRNENFRRLLANREVIKLMLSAQMRAAVREVVQQAEKEGGGEEKGGP